MFLPVKNREKKNEPSAPQAPLIDRCTERDGRKSRLSERRQVRPHIICRGRGGRRKPLSEMELVRQLQAGSRTAFDQIYERYHVQAFRTAAFLTGSRADAEDVVQETFVQVWLHAGKLKEPAGFKSWFYRILTRLAWKCGRDGRREIPDEEIAARADREQEGDGLSSFLGKEERERIRRAVENLDEKHRTIVVLYYFNDFTTPEIARITGCLEGTVKSRLHTARKKLERCLAKEEAGGKLLCAVSHAK